MYEETSGTSPEETFSTTSFRKSSWDSFWGVSWGFTWGYVDNRLFLDTHGTSPESIFEQY